MKFVDDSQNLRVRLRLIQAFILVLLGVLCLRLYKLQIIDGKHYADVAENQRIRLLPIPAPRGMIFDRNGKVLVDSRPIYSVILSREISKSVDYSLLKPLSEGLMIDEAFLRERFDQLIEQDLEAVGKRDPEHRNARLSRTRGSGSEPARGILRG